MFNFFKRKGKALMLTDEQIKAMTVEQRAELLTKLQAEEQSSVKDVVVETQQEEIKQEIVEQVVVEEEVVEEEIVQEEKPNELELKLKEIETKIDDKITELLSNFEKKLAEKETVIENLNAKLQELERTAPLSAPQRLVREQDLVDPDAIKKASIVNHYYGKK